MEVNESKYNHGIMGTSMIFFVLSVFNEIRDHRRRNAGI